MFTEVIPLSLLGKTICGFVAVFAEVKPKEVHPTLFTNLMVVPNVEMIGRRTDMLLLYECSTRTGAAQKLVLCVLTFLLNNSKSWL
jgi:hypothetical protein